MVPVRSVDVNSRHPGLLAPNSSFQGFLSCLKNVSMDFLPYGLKFLLGNATTDDAYSAEHYSIDKDFNIRIGKERYLNTENDLQNFIAILTTQMCSPKTV